MGSYQQFKYKKHFIRKNVFMRKHMFLNITVVVALMLAISFCMACSGGQADNHEKIDYTVVENEDLPIELKKLIDNKKQTTLRLTYTTKDYTYIVAGYGTKETSGYSIRVDDVYVSGNAVYADFKLIGPAEGEQVNEVSCYASCNTKQYIFTFKHLITLHILIIYNSKTFKQ